MSNDDERKKQHITKVLEDYARQTNAVYQPPTGTPNSMPTQQVDKKTFIKNLFEAISPPKAAQAATPYVGPASWNGHGKGEIYMNKSEKLFRMLAMRMRWDIDAGLRVPPKFHDIVLAESASGATVYVHVLTNDDQHVLLEDEGPMFPSDNLITKLRVLTS